MKKIYQRDAQDCGVTCLSYIIQYYNGYVPIEKLRDDTNTNQNGCTAYDLTETLKKYNFDSFGKKINLIELKTIIFPGIVHLILENGFQHFVVITSVNSRYIKIMDPVWGKTKYTYSQFQKIWNGIVILAIPKSEVPHLPREKNILLLVWKILMSEKNLVFKIVFLSFIVSILTLLSSFYLKIGLNYILNSSAKILFIIFSVFGSLTLIRLFLNYGKEKLKLYLNKNIEVTFMYSFLIHIFNIPLHKFQTYREGEILTRIEEVKEIKSLVSDVCVTFCLEFLFGIFALFLLYFLNISLFIVLLVGMFFYSIIGIICGRFFFRVVLKIMNYEVKWKDNLIEVLSGIPTMKHLNVQNYWQDYMETSLCENIDVNLKYQKQIIFLQSFKDSFLEFLFFVIMSYGVYQIFYENLNVIDFITFQNLYLYFISPIKDLVDMIPKFYYLKGIILKISEFVAIEEEKKDEDVSLFSIECFSFKDLSFSYNSLVWNLNKISFDVKCSEHIFLKGDSGVGKSTICRLLIKELEDYKGVIMVNDLNLRDISLFRIRKNIVYLSQQEKIFYATIRENILFGKEVSDIQFQEVCKICHLDEVVQNKPFRYETTVNETILSGGEKQRIILARTLLRKASVYLFDECLSEVEEKKEKEIIKNFRKYLSDKIIIYISHRNTSKLFERVIKIENNSL